MKNKTENVVIHDKKAEIKEVREVTRDNLNTIQNDVVIGKLQLLEQKEVTSEISTLQVENVKSYSRLMFGKAQQSESNNEIVQKNKDYIESLQSAIDNSTIEQSIDSEDLKTIQEITINSVRQEAWYQEAIGEIENQGIQKGLPSEQINQEIKAYQATLSKKLLPVMIIEIENQTIKRKDGTTMILKSNTILENKSYQAFKKLYEKFIENPLLDLTDLNYLSREGIAESTSTGLENQLINAIGTNRDIENFLFNNPQANPEAIHDNLQGIFQKPLSKKQQIKIAGLLGKTLPKDNTNRSKNQINKEKKKKQELKKTVLPPSRGDEFLDKINTFTNKRINQSLLLGHCQTLRETFGLVTSQGTKLVDAIAFDFNELSIEESGKNISQNIIYQNLSSTLRIDGSDGKVTIPNTLSSLRGIKEMKTITTLPVSLQKRKTLLTKASTLTEKELFACKNWADVQTRITEKIRLAAQKNQSSLGGEKNNIAENLEKESMVMNFTNFMTGSVNTKNTEQINKNMLSKNENNQDSMKQILQKRTQGKQGSLPMNLQELKTLNTFFMDKKVQKLVGNQEGIPSDNRDKFMETVGFYKRGPNAPFSEIITFFSSIKEMAYSQVDHEHENGYLALQELLDKKGFPGVVNYKQDHTVLIS